jgi:type I restriction-modification system DNA methylase subunit
MSEELIQRNLYKAPEKMGAWSYYNIGATSLKALKSAKIIHDRDYAEFEGKKPDALIIKKPQVIAAIEFKKPSQLKTKKQLAAAISQEIGTALALGAKIYIVTDGQKTFWINPLTGNEVTTDKREPITLNFNKDDDECVKLISKAIASLSSTNDALLSAVVVDPLPLARKVWQDLWQATGAAPENCLYTFVEIFIFKYLSDLDVLTGSDSFPDLIGRYNKDSDERVLQIYADTIRKNIKSKFPRNEIDGTTIINGTLFVTKDNIAVEGYATVFRRILERFRDFGTLEKIDYDFKSKLFETFLKESISKKNWGQFFTPLKVVRAIVSMADISAGMKICDPACGVGKFLLEPILHDIHRYFKVENGELRPQITLSGFDKGFDKDEQKTIILAKANMLIYLSSMIRDNSSITRQFAALFNKTFLLQTNSILGTLARPEVDEYDLVLTNPPYVMSGSSNLKDEIAKRTPDEVSSKQKSVLEQHYAVNAMGVEGLFMEWIVRALKPSGKAFVVVPDGIMNRSNDKRLRDFILAECDIDAIISLPINTFFTTNKKTYIMALTKKEVVSIDGVQTKVRQATPVFTYLCSEIGESRDTYRFDIEQNDLDTAAQLFNMFKGVKSTLATAQKLCESDSRCKVVNIDEFYNGSHWSVERWWTREERIDLGVEDDIESVTPEDMGGLVEDLANTLFAYKDQFVGLQKKKSGLTYKAVSITDSTYFEVVSSRQLGKTLVELVKLPKGEIPVFSAAKAPILGLNEMGNQPIFASESNPVLSFASNGDGSAGRNFVIHTQPFYIKAERIAFRPTRSDIWLPYVWSQIFDIKERFKFSRTFLSNRQNLKIVFIDFPLNEDGTFDIETQKLVAAQFELVNQLKDEVNDKRDQISRVSVDVDLSDYSIVYKPLSTLLSPVKGKSKYTRKYGDEHKGEYPVFSASSATPLTFIDNYDYDGEYLSWSTNGFAGTVAILNGRFSINGDRGLLIPKTELVDIRYLRYILEPIFRNLAKGRKGDKGEDEFTKLYPSMIENVDIPLPIDGDGNISLVFQQEIAQMYTTIEQYRGEVLRKIDNLIEQRISF